MMSFEQIIETRKKQLLEKKIPTEQEPMEGYQLFHEKLSPDITKDLDG